YKSTIKALVAAIDAKDPYTSGHSQRVAEYAMLGAAMISLPYEELQDIEFGGLLHDIGKIAIEASILSKPGDLTSEEWSVMHRHTIIGASIINGIPFLEKARECVLYHHERYDGSGYPEGLKGEAIPIGARLVAVADAFDTMTSERSYHGAVDADRALSELRRCSGTQFCPVAADAFFSAFQLNRGKLLSKPVTEYRQLV
ncbi:HD-GYP domain-containing protein, partial [Chloroflexota bacterium]